jgi:hypothetical protein
MINKIISVIVVVAIFATVAYQMGWLSSEGENAYDDVEEAVKDAIN